MANPTIHIVYRPPQGFQISEEEIERLYLSTCDPIEQPGCIPIYHLHMIKSAIDKLNADMLKRNLWANELKDDLGRCFWTICELLVPYRILLVDDEDAVSSRIYVVSHQYIERIKERVTCQE